MYKLNFKVVGVQPDFKPITPGEQPEEAGTGKVRLEVVPETKGPDPFLGEAQVAAIEFTTTVPEVYASFSVGKEVRVVVVTDGGIEIELGEEETPAVESADIPDEDPPPPTNMPKLKGRN